jgi:hypothetical protein
MIANSHVIGNMFSILSEYLCLSLVFTSPVFRICVSGYINADQGPNLDFTITQTMEINISTILLNFNNNPFDRLHC